MSLFNEMMDEHCEELARKDAEIAELVDMLDEVAYEVQ